MAEDKFYLDSLLRCRMIRAFSSEVGGGFSKVNSLSYNILHVIVQIGGGGVVEPPELTSRSFFQL